MSARDQLSQRAALFLDRDGVINVDVGHAHKPEQIEWNPGIFELIASANRSGYLVVIITNQAGIAKGLYSVETFLQLSTWMGEQIARHGGRIDDIEFCPHHPDGIIEEYTKVCDCRKPKPGMLKKLIERHSIDVTRSILIGDKATDIMAGWAVDVADCYLFSPESLAKTEIERLEASRADNLTKSYRWIQSLNQVDKIRS